MSGAWLKVVVACLLVANLPATTLQTESQTPSTAKIATSTASTPSTAEISAAKASHKVWVNLDSGIYHKSGRWYGKTKNGKFMTVDEAKKAGYKPAKRER
jgi:hypothetical protein